MHFQLYIYVVNFASVWSILIANTGVDPQGCVTKLYRYKTKCDTIELNCHDLVN